jgi:O-acetyl-ADP-ribose deacetylase (regulator of RNase III)
MSHLSIVCGNIFTSKTQTIVNTVNCVGVMGAGIALEFRLRYPEMYVKYVHMCEAQKLDIGSLWLFKSPDRWVLNFPTKKHWRYPTKEQYLHAGLKKFVSTYSERGIQSVAFPILGSSKGGLDPNRSLEIMESHLSRCTIPIEIYRYDPLAPDELYDRFREQFLRMSPDDLRSTSGLRVSHLERIRAALQDPEVRQLNQLGAVEGIGIKSLEVVFRLASNASRIGNPAQESLFD